MATVSQTETDHASMNDALARLAKHKDAWAKTDFARRLELLESLRAATDRHASQWVDAAARAKGVVGTPWVGEEWVSGPWALLESVQHLTGTLKTLRDDGDPLQGSPVRTRADGQVVVQVHPANHWERLLISGVEADVWMQPEVTRENLRDTMGVLYRDRPTEGRVALVLGAGNIASIPPLDVLYKLFVEGQVCLLKMNPVNDYLGPIFEKIFAAFVDAGYLAFAYGGAKVGQYLTEHESVDEIHITGSERTHDAIIFGVGDEGARRKADDAPINLRRMTSELGGISPVIVVPGPWTAADLAFQAENIVTQKMHNGGFNCIASQVMILPETWEHNDALLQAVRDTFANVPPRKPYYPGASDRIAAVAAAHPEATILDADAETPASVGDGRGRQRRRVLLWQRVLRGRACPDQPPR